MSHATLLPRVRYSDSPIPRSRHTYPSDGYYTNGRIVVRVHQGHPESAHRADRYGLIPLEALGLTNTSTEADIVAALADRCAYPGCTEAAICEPHDDDTPTWCHQHCSECGEDER